MPARVATVGIDHLTKHSPVVIVGSVSSIRVVAGVRIAEVEPSIVCKGGSQKRIAFVAESTWACDISDAVVGERALLYLYPAANIPSLQAAGQILRREGTTLFQLSHAGRGRIPLLKLITRWVAIVHVGPDTAPQLNLNLVLPHNAPVDRSRTVSLVSLNYLLSRASLHARK